MKGALAYQSTTRRRGWSGAAALAGVLVLLACTTAHASDWTQCMVPGQATAELRIESCTRLIEAGNMTPSDLGDAYFSRGVGYRQQGDFDRAIADYTVAIRLAPNARVLVNRGAAYG